jgi:NADH-quinone oxidoreductase subunit J
MLSRGVMDPTARRFNNQWGLVAGFAAVFFVLLTAVLTRMPWQVTIADAPADAIQQLGAELVSPYTIPFEVASILLVVAMIGAIIVARERES